MGEKVFCGMRGLGPSPAAASAISCQGGRGWIDRGKGVGWGLTDYGGIGGLRRIDHWPMGGIGATPIAQGYSISFGLGTVSPRLIWFSWAFLSGLPSPLSSIKRRRSFGNQIESHWRVIGYICSTKEKAGNLLQFQPVLYEVCTFEVCTRRLLFGTVSDVHCFSLLVFAGVDCSVTAWPS